jgi:hypothetical protein
MALLLDCPAEILIDIVRYVNYNSDVSSLRLVNRRLAEIIRQQAQILINDFRSKHGLSKRVTDTYLTSTSWSSLPPTTENNVLDTVSLRHFLRRMDRIATDLDRAVWNSTCYGQLRSRFVNREPFMLFAALSDMLEESTTVLSLTGTVLAPCASGQTFAPKQLTPRLIHFLEHEISLDELESIITLINVCATKLWSSIFLFQNADTAVTSFGSLGGYSFNTDLAILTEHVIWKGPKWVSWLLKLQEPTSGGSKTSSHGQARDSVLHNGIWNGSREDGARIAANGVARLLWRERHRKIEQKQQDTPPGTIQTEELQPASTVWHIPSADM